MNIKEFQQEVKKVFEIFSKTKNTKMDSEHLFIHLVEEIGEIARELVNEKIGRSETRKEKIAEEIADAIIFLVAIADYYGIDIEKILEKDLEKIKKIA